MVASEIAKGHTKGETTGKGLKKLAAAMLVAAALLSPSFAWAEDATTKFEPAADQASTTAVAVYTKDEADRTFATQDQLQADVAATNEELAKKADKATTLKGYGITDAYTQTEVDNKVDAEKTARESADSALDSRTSALEAKTGSLNRVAAANSTSINESMTLKDKQYSATLQVNGSGAQIGVVNNSAAGLANDGGTAYTEYRARTGAILSKATNDISSTSSNGQVVDTAGDTTGEYSQVATAKSTGTTFTYSNDGGKTSTSTTIKGDSVSTGTVSATAGITDGTTTDGTSVKASQTVGQNLNALDERITNVKEYVLSETNNNYVSKTDAAVQDGAIVKAANTVGENVALLDKGLSDETNARIWADKSQDKRINEVAAGIASVNTALATQVGILNQQDANEAATRAAADTELNERITNEANAIHETTNQLQSDLTTETTAREAADTALDTRITNVKEYLEKQTSDKYVSKDDAAVQDGAIVKAANTIGDNVTKLDAALAKETAARLGADAAQDKVIQTVNDNLVSSVNTINKNMADGFNALSQVDANELAGRVAADTELVKATNGGLALNDKNVLQKNETTIAEDGTVTTKTTAADTLIMNEGATNQITLSKNGIKVGTNSTVIASDGVFAGGDTAEKAKAALNADGSIKGANGAFTVDKSGNVTSNGTVTGKTLTDGIATLQNGNLNTTGNVNAHDIVATGDISGKAITGTSLNTQGGSISGGAITGTSLNTQGGAINGGAITGTSINGTTGTFGSLTTTGNASVGGTLTANGITNTGNTTTDSLTVKQGATVGGNLAVTGDITGKSLNVGTGDIKGGQITGTGLDVGAGTIKTTGAVETGTLKTTGNADIGGNLNVEGDLSVEGEFNAKTLSSKLDENNYTTINGGKTESMNLKMDKTTGEIQASASTFNETGSNAWAKDDDSIGESSMTADKISQSLSDTGDNTKNIASRELSQNTDNKYEITDSVVEGNQSNVENRTADTTDSQISLKDDSGKVLNKSYITQNLKKVLMGVEEGGNKTTIEQDANNITNTAKNGTIKNDADKVLNQGTTSVISQIGDGTAVKSELTAGGITNTAVDGTITNSAKDLVNTATGNMTNTVGGKLLNDVTGDMENKVGGNLTTTVTGKVTEDYKSALDTKVGGNETHYVKGNQTNTVSGDRTVNVKGTEKENFNAQVTNIKTDQKTSVGGNQTNIVAGNQQNTVSGSKTESVKGSVTETYGSQSTTVNGNQSNTVKGTLTETVTGDVTEDYKANLSTTVGGNQTTTVTGDSSLSAKNISNTATEKLSNSAAEIENTASKSITDKVGENTSWKMTDGTVVESVKDASGKTNQTTTTATDTYQFVKDSANTLAKRTSSTNDNLNITDGTNTYTKITTATGNKQTVTDGAETASTNLTKSASNTLIENGTQSVLDHMAADTSYTVMNENGNGSRRQQTASEILDRVTDGTDTSEVKQTASEVATSAKDISNTATEKITSQIGDGSAVKSEMTADGITNTATKITNITGDNTVTSDTNGTTFENTNKKDTVTFMDEEKSVDTKKTTISGNTITTGEAVMDYADVMKDLGVRGNATIKGDTTMEGNASVGKDLTVAGTSTLTGDVTMENNATVRKNLTVEGDTSLKNTKVDGTLDVTGKSTLKGSLEVTGGTTTDKLHVTSTSQFDGAATFKDIVTMEKDLNVGGNAKVAGDVMAKSFKVGENTYIDENGINANGQVIKNVGKGDISNANSTDAVSGGQLYETNTRVTGLETRMGTVETKVDKLDNKIDKVGANAAAMANLHPLEFDEDSKWNIAAAVGSSGSETASAVGVFYRPNENVMVNASAAMGTGENMFGGGVSLRLGHGGNKAKEAQMKAAAKENRELRAKVDDLTARMDALLSVLNPNMSKDFPDVPENHWAYEAVSRLAGNGIVEGYEDGKYHGERQMTRYEMAEIIYNALSKGAKAEKKLVEEFRPELQAMAAQKKA